MTAEDMKRRYEERKALGRRLLGSVCVVCGTTERLEFDHIDPKTKSMPVSSLMKARLEVFLTEIAKCQLLCRPHHVEKSKRNRETSGGHNKIVNPAHGTAARYGGSFRCRCNACRHWKTLYRKGLVDSLGHARPGSVSGGTGA